MSDIMWAPWRMEYITGPKAEGGCVLCRARDATRDARPSLLVLAARPTAFVLMNRFPYSHGHIMIVPRRHVAKLEALTGEERDGLFRLVVDAQAALTQALSSHGLNIGMNLGKVAGAGIDDHLHVHAVPRWDGDTNFMPMLADVRVMAQHLDDTYAALRARFAPLDEDAP
ncbi:MAG: HIT domain-containing protein [Proteobacteria bacterium]|nr:HIT domain-containing protein [Pseudomonadota bacterium]